VQQFQTIDIYRGADGTYTPERGKLHEHIISKMLEKAALAIPALGEKATLTLIGGRGGAGKSYFSKVVNYNNAIVFDNDIIKSMLPEYRGWNAGLVHEEACDVMATAEEIAMKRGFNIIHIATLKSARSGLKVVIDFSAHGYEIEGYFMHTQPEVSAVNVLSRFFEGGGVDGVDAESTAFRSSLPWLKPEEYRVGGPYVPIKYTVESLTNERNFLDLTPRFRKWSIYNNNAGDFNPRLMAQGQGETVTLLDLEAGPIAVLKPPSPLPVMKLLSRLFRRSMSVCPNPCLNLHPNPCLNLHCLPGFSKTTNCPT
jgi:predicted ABC-type ATPase